MNIVEVPKDLHIVISADIVARKKLTLEEKYVLSRIRAVPGCGNVSLSEVLGITVSGVEAMMARLRREGHIEMLGEGKARTHRVLPRGGDPKDSGQSVAGSDAQKNSGHANTSAAPVEELSVFEDYQQARKWAANQVLNGQLRSNFLPFQHLTERVASDATLSKQQAAMLMSNIEDDTTRFMILHGGANEIASRMCGREDFFNLLKFLFNASHRVLAELRPRLDTATEPPLRDMLLAISDDINLRETQSAEAKLASKGEQPVSAPEQAAPAPAATPEPKRPLSLKERLAAPC